MNTVDPVLPSSVVKVPDRPLVISDDLKTVLGPDADRVAQALEAGKAVPRARFLLKQGGVPWAAGNALLQKWRMLADGSVDAYSSSIKAWLDWAEVNGLDPDADLTEANLLTFQQDRIEEDGIMPKTWNKSMAPMSALAHHLLQQQSITSLPWTTRSQFNVREGALPIRSIDAPTFAEFRNIGLLGYLPDRSYDETFTSTTRLRDGLFADLLVSNGMRRIEAASLLIPDLPRVEEDRPRDRGWLPSPITKGQKGRQYVVLRGWRDKLRVYHESEWHTQHHYAQAAYEKAAASMNVATEYDPARRSLLVNGKWKRIDTMDRDFRSHLLANSEVAQHLGLPADDGWLVSLAVFPGTRAPAVGAAGWTQTFAEANHRVQRLTTEYGMEEPQRVTPHMLRHTFAIHFLRDALRVMDERQRKAVEKQDLARLEKFLLNPLTELKNLLGHSSMDTTLLYLREAVHQDRWYDSTFSNLGDAFLSMVDREEEAS